MTVATAFRSAITSTINNLGSTFTFTPITITQNTGGYDPNTEVAGIAVSVTGVIDRDQKISKRMNLGQLPVETFRIWMKYDDDIALNTDTLHYEITWQSTKYEVKEFKPYYMQDIIVAKMIVITKRFD